jgi:hypothetical protein
MDELKTTNFPMFALDELAHNERSFPEDYHLENGNYMCQCIVCNKDAIPIEDKLELAIKGLKNIATCDPKHYCSEDLIFIANMFLAKIEKGE